MMELKRMKTQKPYLLSKFLHPQSPPKEPKTTVLVNVLGPAPQSMGANKKIAMVLMQCS